MSHITTVLCQGHVFRLEEFKLLDTTWKSYTFNVPRNTVKFLFNPVLDTQLTNSNLMRWGKRSNSKCELCSHHEILLHTLNNCPTMLKDGRYTWRHNSVLSHMFTLAQNLRKKQTGSFIPTCLVTPTNVISLQYLTNIWVTAQTPDIVMINRPQKIAILIELSVFWNKLWKVCSEKRK